MSLPREILGYDVYTPERQQRLREQQPLRCPECEVQRERDAMIVIAYTVIFCTGVLVGIGIGIMDWAGTLW